MPAPVRVRLACDRCHSQKLRCPKEPGTAVCLRCAKAGAVCVFSPPGRASAAQSLPNRTNHVARDNHAAHGGPEESAGVEMALDWPFMYDGLSLDELMNTPSSDQNPGHLTVQEPDASSPPQDPWNPSDDLKSSDSCSQRLVKLMGHAESILARLPHGSELHASQGPGLDSFATEFTKKYASLNFLELAFSTLQGLIDIYPDAIKTALGLNPEPEEPCQIPNCIHIVPIPPVLAAISASILSDPKIDMSVANLIIACHLRLLDVFARALACSFACFQITFSSPTQTEPEFHIPDLRVGSFVPPKNSAAVMQVVLLRTLLSTLSEQLKQFTESLAEIATRESNRQIDCLSLQCEVLRERHDTAVERLSTVGTAMMEIAVPR